MSGRSAAGRVLSKRPAPAPLLLMHRAITWPSRYLETVPARRIGSVTGHSATRPRLGRSSPRVWKEPTRPPPPPALFGSSEEEARPLTHVNRQARQDRRESNSVNAQAQPRAREARPSAGTAGWATICLLHANVEPLTNVSYSLSNVTPDARSRETSNRWVSNRNNGDGDVQDAYMKLLCRKRSDHRSSMVRSQVVSNGMSVAPLEATVQRCKYLGLHGFQKYHPRAHVLDDSVEPRLAFLHAAKQ